MAEVNLFCDVAGCGQVACGFGIKGNTKEKCCQHHMVLLSNKNVTIYSISGYNFISSFEDVPIYETRRAMKERGLGKLTTLEAQLDTELSKARCMLEDNEKKSIAMVVRSYLEIKLQMEWMYENCKQQLQAMRHIFEQYLVSKHNELYGSAHLLCEDDIRSLRFLRLMAEDCTLEIAKAISGSWRGLKEDVDTTITLLDQSKRTEFLVCLADEAADELRMGHGHLSLELNLYARELGWNGDCSEAKRMILEKETERVKELQQMFQLAKDSDTDKALAKGIVAECIQAGLTAKSELDIPQSRIWLQNAWDILKRSESTEKEVTIAGLALWEVVGLYSGNYPEAESILRHCYDVEAGRDPLSEDAMKVSNAIAGVFYHSGNWKSAVDVCTWVLQNFSYTNHAAEHFWTALHYLTHSYWYQEKNEEAQDVVEKWQSKRMVGESQLSEALKLTVIAQYAQKQRNHAEAEKWLIRAITIADQHFPVSELLALDHSLLGALYYELEQFYEAKKHCMQAKEIYEAFSPMSVNAASNLNKLGLLYYDLKQFNEAEEHYRKANEVYQAVYPLSLSAAINLNSLGLLNKCLDRLSEAEEYFKKAKEIYEVVSPESNSAALNLSSLGSLYRDSELFSEAEEHCRKAKSIYEAVSPGCLNAALNLNILGNVYEAMGNLNEAISSFNSAKIIFLKHHRTSDAQDAKDTADRLTGRGR